jgi:hypothetical protein
LQVLFSYSASVPERASEASVDFGASISTFAVTMFPLHRRDPNGGAVSRQFDLGSWIQLQQIKDWAIHDHRPAVPVFNQVFIKK